MLHCNGLAFLSQRSHQRIQKNLFMAIICSSPSGMAYDLYLTGSLHPSRTLYPPFPVLSCLCTQCRRDLQPQPHKYRLGGSCLCVLSLLQRLYLKQERNRRASCLELALCSAKVKQWQNCSRILENAPLFATGAKQPGQDTLHMYEQRFYELVLGIQTATKQITVPLKLCVFSPLDFFSVPHLTLAPFLIFTLRFVVCTWLLSNTSKAVLVVHYAGPA